MATILQLRRGTTVQHSTFAGAEGEVTIDITKDTIVVHDGVTNGGFALARESAVANSISLTDLSGGTGLDYNSSTGVFDIDSTVATKNYVDSAATTAVAAVIDAAPATLDTLNELAAALGDDANFSTTITTSIGTKLNSSAVSAYGLTLIDDADADAARTTLGLGTAATTAATAYATAAQGTTADAALPSASYTAADVLVKLLTVDGSGSGLDADTLDGQSSAYFRINIYNAAGTLLN
jgi:hypothetical protein